MKEIYVQYFAITIFALRHGYADRMFFVILICESVPDKAYLSVCIRLGYRYGTICDYQNHLDFLL